MALANLSNKVPDSEEFWKMFDHRFEIYQSTKNITTLIFVSRKNKTGFYLMKKRK